LAVARQTMQERWGSSTSSTLRRRPFFAPRRALPDGAVGDESFGERETFATADA
jgi:hypothetical protein